MLSYSLEALDLNEIIGSSVFVDVKIMALIELAAADKMPPIHGPWCGSSL